MTTKPIDPKRYAREPYWITHPQSYRERADRILGWLCLLGCGVAIGLILSAGLGLI